MLLARMFSGLVSAFQTTELAIEDPSGGDARLPLAQLHEVLEAAFVLPGD